MADNDLPSVKFPKGYAGWLVILLSSFVGMVAGSLTIILVGKLIEDARNGGY